MPTLVYIVDDDVHFASMVEMFFNSLPGFSAQAFTSSHPALSCILAKPPAVLILDIIMPEMQGDEFAEHIREAGVNCPIIVLTGLLTPDEARHKNYRIGQRVVAGKPVPLTVLQMLVHQALDASSSL